MTTGPPALTPNWPASLPATLRAFPPPAHRAIGEWTSQSAPPPCRSAPCARPRRGGAIAPLAGRAQGALLQMQTSASDEQRSCSSPVLLTVNPCAAVRGGRSGPQGDRQDADPFSSGQEPCRKARPALTDLPGLGPASAKRGALSFGYFSLSKQRKVTRRPAGRRKRRRRARPRKRARKPRKVTGSLPTQG